jgi:tripartite-type tricarboxylate transporter receptor subunit TctC
MFMYMNKRRNDEGGARFNSFAIRTPKGAAREDRMLKTVAKFTAAVVALSALTVGSFADEVFPSRPIELIVHRSGSSTWIGSRIIAEGLSASLGSPVVVIPKPEAGGSGAPNYAARAKPDGYTLFIVNSGTNGTMPLIMNVRYKNSDFDYYALYGTQPMVFAVKSDSRFKTVKDLVDEAKQNPHKLLYSTSSFGSQSHFVMEMFKLAAGVKIDQVPYENAPESVTGLLGGFVDVASSYLVDVKGQVDAGALRILATPEEKRIPEYPNAPTFAESGYPSVMTTAWFGVGAPRGVPKPIADKIKTHLERVINDPVIKQKLVAIGYTPAYMASAEFTKFAEQQQALFAETAKDARLEVK